MEFSCNQVIEFSQVGGKDKSDTIERGVSRAATRVGRCLRVRWLSVLLLPYNESEVEMYFVVIIESEQEGWR